MSRNQIIFAVVVALVTVVGAYTQGKITDRWENEISQELETFTLRLEDVPTQIGNWISEEVPVDEAQFKASNCHGRVSRTYRNAVTGEAVNIFLTSGKGYHVTIHTPDFCYVAAGYEMGNEPQNYRVNDVPEMSPEPEFLNTLFKKVTPTETTHLRILWSYTADGMWTAPKLAKYSLGTKDALYKLYLISEIGDGVPPIGEDPTVAFAKEFLPAINKVMFPKETEPVVDPSEEVVEG